MRMDLRDLRDKKYFIFDLDGTLIDSFENHKQGMFQIQKALSKNKNLYQKLLEEYDLLQKEFPNKSGRQIRYLVYERLMLDKEAMDHEHHFLGEAGIYYVPRRSWDFKSLDKMYWSGVGECAALFPDVIDTLVSLKAADKKLSIVTNGKEVQHRKLECFNETISGLVPFDFQIVTGDYGVESYKPNPKCLNKILDLYGANRSDAVYIGDKIVDDYGAARNAGIEFILIDRNECHSAFAGNRIFDLQEMICEN